MFFFVFFRKASFQLLSQCFISSFCVYFFPNIGNCTKEKEDDFYICLIKNIHLEISLIRDILSFFYLNIILWFTATIKLYTIVSIHHSIIVYPYYRIMFYGLPLLSNYVLGCSFTCQDGLFKRHLLIL